MFKSEIANRIISLIGFWIVVIIALFNDNNIENVQIFWGIVIVFTAFHLYGITNLRKKNRNEILK